jgi:broad specificity phosphatase PhoE
LRRCLQTTQLAFAPFIAKTMPVVTERLRERLGVKPCDQRSSKTWIASAFPNFRIEDGFVEDDELWQSDRRETIEEHIERTTGFLLDLFKDDQNQAVALVMHSGAVMALFGATGWAKVFVEEGAVYPLLVRATRTIVDE